MQLNGLVQQATQAMQEARWADAIRAYIGVICTYPELASYFSFTLNKARQNFRAERVGKPAQVGVSCYELSHNPAGRSLAIAELYGEHAEVEIFGSIFPSWGHTLWAPMQGHPIPCHYFTVEESKKEDRSDFFEQALELVLQHPYDVVHLSKPRGPNLIFGLLYKWVWGARVLWDIDDEELGFLRPSEPGEDAKAIRLNLNFSLTSSLVGLARGQWTQLSVGSVDLFDGVTVSNPALQQRYGGSILPHARSFEVDLYSKEYKRRSRERFGIPRDAKVVLFFGTPRSHKGLLETAKALAALHEPTLRFVIVGDFPDTALKTELESVKGVTLQFIKGQPYSRICEVVALGDYSVILQDSRSLVARFQTPAKLTDALAASTVVFATELPALQDFFDAKALVPVTPANLVDVLREYILAGDAADKCRQLRANGLAFYESHLKSDAHMGKIQEWCAPVEVPTLQFALKPELDMLLKHLLQIKTKCPLAAQLTFSTI